MLVSLELGWREASEAAMATNEPSTRLEVCACIYYLFITLDYEHIRALLSHFHCLALTGKICCNSGLLASWQWVSFLMEQYADNRRLLCLLVSGNSCVFWWNFQFVWFLNSHFSGVVILLTSQFVNLKWSTIAIWTILSTFIFSVK